MTEESLRALLGRAREHLGAGGATDPESRQLLAEIERAVGSTSPAGAGHVSRLEALAVRIEASHPALAETLRELGDALVKAGI
jgi:hypothetical protein